MKACRKGEGVPGRVHSIESFGAHEGPGIRYLVFMQGCLARCLYCQNPDTWPLKEGNIVYAKEVFKNIEKCLPYMSYSGGGVTLTGGEPLLQADFAIELFKLCKKNGVNTAIDTSGFYAAKTAKKALDKLVGITDLFLVDIKAPNPALHKKITGRSLDEVLAFLTILEKKKRPYWIRYVLVPGLNNSAKNMAELRAILKGLKYMKKFEFLPYHTLGKNKWKMLGFKYPLCRTPAANSNDIKSALAILNP